MTSTSTTSTQRSAAPAFATAAGYAFGKRVYRAQDHEGHVVDVLAAYH